MIELPAPSLTPDPNPADTIPATSFSGRPLLVLVDVDGTLAPIALQPSHARVPDSTRRVVAQLVTHPGVSVALVSGRAAHDARRLVGVDGVWAVGNHGIELLAPNGDLAVDPLVTPYAAVLRQAADALQPLLDPFRDVTLEDKQWTLSVHYRAANPAIVPHVRAIVDDVARSRGLLITNGKKVFEIRPPVEIHKGTAIVRLARDLGALGENASVLFAGDDATDEDAFRLLRAVLPRAVTVHVGDNPDTAAEFTLATPDDVRALLERVLHSLES